MHVDIQLLQHHLLKRLFLSLLNNLGILAENQLTINVRVYFWTLSSLPLIYVYPHASIHFLDYCCFVVSFEIWKCESSNFVLFQDCFGYFWPLAFPYRLLVQPVNFYKEACWDSNRDCVESVDQFGEHYHLNNIKFYNP